MVFSACCPCSCCDIRKHRLTEWLKLEGSSESHPVQPSLLEQGHLEPLAQDHFLLNISKDRDSTGSLFSLHSVTVPQLLLMLRLHLPCLSLCPSTLLLSLDTSEERLALSSLYSPFRYLYREGISSLMSVSVYHGRPGTSKKYHAQSITCFVKNISCF